MRRAYLLCAPHACFKRACKISRKKARGVSLVFLTTSLRLRLTDRAKQNPPPQQRKSPPKEKEKEEKKEKKEKPHSGFKSTSGTPILANPALAYPATFRQNPDINLSNPHSEEDTATPLRPPHLPFKHPLRALISSNRHAPRRSAFAPPPLFQTLPPSPPHGTLRNPNNFAQKLPQIPHKARYPNPSPAAPAFCTCNTLHPAFTPPAHNLATPIQCVSLESS